MLVGVRYFFIFLGLITVDAHASGWQDLKIAASLTTGTATAWILLGLFEHSSDPALRSTICIFKHLCGSAAFQLGSATILSMLLPPQLVTVLRQSHLRLCTTASGA